MNIKHLILFAVLSLTYACGGGSSDGVGQGVSSDPAPTGGSQDQDPPPDPVTQTATINALSDVQAGMCGDFVNEPSGIGFMRVGACDEPHPYEIAGSYELEGGDDDFPGDFALQFSTYRDCRPVFQEFTGQEYTGRGLGIEVLPPNADTWSLGDRTVICLVVNADRSMLTSSTGQ